MAGAATLSLGEWSSRTVTSTWTNNDHFKTERRRRPEFDPIQGVLCRSPGTETDQRTTHCSNGFAGWAQDERRVLSGGARPLLGAKKRRFGRVRI